jgi:hypothetical protein
MTISPDDAREMLATVEVVEQRVLDVATRRAIGLGLVAQGWIGLVGFGLQSRLAELWYGEKVLSGYTGSAIILACLAVPVMVFRPFIRPMLIKIKAGYHAQVTMGGTLAFAIAMLILFPNEMPGPAALAACMAFSYGLGLTIAQMLWLGRWQACGACAILLVISLIHAHQPNPEMKYAYLALFSALVLLPVGAWMMLEDRKHDA